MHQAKLSPFYSNYSEKVSGLPEVCQFEAEPGSGIMPTGLPQGCLPSHYPALAKWAAPPCLTPLTKANVIRKVLEILEADDFPLSLHNPPFRDTHPVLNNHTPPSLQKCRSRRAHLRNRTEAGPPGEIFGSPGYSPKCWMRFSQRLTLSGWGQNGTGIISEQE